ncbi:hypothetical protein FA15DRAFT_674385 [Coprinopsis marcescibilis]|uniref:Uncharacterized protein n=1 Tax=Coprinopsis marcescibilis TaxID=230819 RepID=A0A5C3KH16_COPMA|nr:hypothetical protein FA15DRAFT_674385 [Coprinopsis marcescibilis]
MVKASYSTLAVVVLLASGALPIVKGAPLDQGEVAIRNAPTEELEVRIIGKILGGIGKFFGFGRDMEAEAEDLTARNTDRGNAVATRNGPTEELEARIIGKIFSGIGKFFGFGRDIEGDAEDLITRHMQGYDELEVRLFEKLFDAIESREFDDGLDQLSSRELREYDELEARIIKNILGGIKSFFGFRREELGDEIAARELQEPELEARIFGLVFKGISLLRSAFKKRKRDLDGQEFDLRDLENDELDLLVRDFVFDELVSLQVRDYEDVGFRGIYDGATLDELD